MSVISVSAHFVCGVFSVFFFRVSSCFPAREKNLSTEARCTEHAPFPLAPPPQSFPHPPTRPAPNPPPPKAGNKKNR